MIKFIPILSMSEIIQAVENYGLDRRKYLYISLISRSLNYLLTYLVLVPHYLRTGSLYSDIFLDVTKEFPESGPLSIAIPT